MVIVTRIAKRPLYEGRWGMRAKPRNWAKKEGQSLVLVALMLPLLIGMAGLGVTVGTVYYGQAQLQDAVDAGAMAGAQALSTASDPNAPQDQTAIVSQNDPRAQNVFVLQSPINSRLVTASATALVPGTFAALIGHNSFLVQAKAVASISPGLPFNYTVFQGDPNKSDAPLLLNGNSSVDSSTGGDTADVHSNNDLELNGNISVDGSCGGNPSVTQIGNTSCAGGVIQAAPEIAMPQWTPAEASPANATVLGSPQDLVGMTVQGNTSTSGNYIIYGNMTIDGNSTVTGHYLIEDGNIIINGNASITGSLVTFGGGISLNGNVSQSNGGVLALAAFTSNGQVASDATNPSPANPPTPGSIDLNGNVSVNSILYAPDSYVDLNGNVSVNGGVVGYVVSVNGNVTITGNPSDLSAVPVQQVTLIQ